MFYFGLKHHDWINDESIQSMNCSSGLAAQQPSSKVQFSILAGLNVYAELTLLSHLI